MTYARRRIGIPLAFLWALAQGMWIGAGWHASSQFGVSGYGAAKTQHCNCTYESRSHAPKAVLSAQVKSADACPFCILGALSPDVPAVFAIESPALPQPVCATPVRSDCSSVNAMVLPPSRAPPAV
jgi:hypothetical protein